MKYIHLVGAIIICAVMPTQAVAEENNNNLETRFIFLDVSKGWDTKYSGDFPQINPIPLPGIEQQLSAKWSVSLRAVGSLFYDEAKLDSVPLELKYRFTEAPKSFYVKGGLHHYKYKLAEKNLPFRKTKGTGASLAFGWQSHHSGGFGYSVETWYRPLKHSDVYGVSAMLSYGFNWL